MNVILILFLTVLNGLFAMSELAVASSRKARLEAMRDSGERGATAAIKLVENPTRFLSTVQVGITSIGMLNGIVGDAAFSAPLAAWLTRIGVAAAVAPALATATVVVTITFITIIFGELVPKRIGQMFPELVARWIAPPMTWLAALAKPFVAMLALCTQATLRLLRIDDSHANLVTEAEISASLLQGVSAGLIEEQEHQMVRNVFHLDDRPLTSLMLPRSEIEWLNAELTIGAALEQIRKRGALNSHSWYPVCRGDLDNVVGLISTARLLEYDEQSSATLSEYMIPAQFVPETLSGLEILEQLRSKSGRLLLVVDEYGVVQGLVTPRDLLEGITGELKPETYVEAWATQVSADRWILDGSMPVSELKARLPIAKLPLEDKGRYNTLAGLLMSISGHVPTKGERIKYGSWTFEITETSGRRIDKVLAWRAARHNEAI